MSTLDMKEHKWSEAYAKLIGAGEREAAQAAFARAMADPFFAQWWDVVKENYDRASPTYPLSDRAFIVYVDYPMLIAAMDAAVKLGWREQRQVFGRHVYEHPTSAVRLTMAERQAFIVGVPEA